MTLSTLTIVTLAWLFLLSIAVLALFAGHIGNRHTIGKLGAATSKVIEMDIAKRRARAAGDTGPQKIARMVGADRGKSDGGGPPEAA